MNPDAEEIEDTLREDLEAAIEGSEGTEEEGGSEEDTEESVGVAETSEAEPDADEGPTGDTEGSEETSEAQESDPEPPIVAPQSWNNDRKADFAGLPRQVQQYIHEREREFSTRIQQNSEGFKYAQAMQEILKPFDAIIQAEGGTHFEAVNQLVRTAAMLRTGSPPQKAQLVAKLVKDYGIGIEDLDKALVNEPVSPELTAMEQMLQQKLQPMEQMLQQYRQQMEQTRAQQTQGYRSEIDQFASTHEHFDEVREEMADMIEVAERRGIKMGLQDAYDRALAFRPDLQARVEAETQAQKIAAKKKAAVSLQPSDKKPEAQEPADTLRAALEQAWDGQAVN